MSDETKDDEIRDEELGGVGEGRDEETTEETEAQQDGEGGEETEGTDDEGGQSEWDPQTATKSQLHGMFKTWFLDYASYTNLDRAVPYIEDGLKPVQRRILHTMSKMDDGRYNKVANIVGATMAYHPHGDASIYGALVTLGQKELLIDTQGNWGNILTGDDAAAPRYIEARLTKFALDVVFNPKTTVWKESYDGRNQEPVTLPVKFPLLLAQGCEGIGVGLASIILPHNFNEIIDAAVAYLKGEEFTLYPDFPTGGSIDVSKYNDGQRGGKVRVRAKIEKRDAKTLVITEIPYSVTTGVLIESIEKVNDKKLKVKKIIEKTAAEVEIIIQLPAGASPDKTIDALYAFTKCEDRISPNACVIINRKPVFLTVSDILRQNTDSTVALLKKEQEIRLGELLEQWHLLSLEKIFIEERIYKDKEFEEAKSTEIACKHIRKRIDKYIADNAIALQREISEEDITHLLEIKMARILRFNSDAAEDKLVALKAEMAKVQHNIDHIIDFTIAYFERLKKQYGVGHERKTEIRSFDNIEATKVAERNRRLYVNREDGFMGYGLKNADFVGECSDIDDVIIFYEDGRYVIKKVDEKVDIGLGIMHIAVFKKNDTRTVYNAMYTDGETHITFAKRFYVSGITRDKEYNITLGTKGTKMRYFSANSNGEAEVVKVLLKPKVKLKNVKIDYDFAQLAVKGRASKGNLVTKNEIHKAVLMRRGESTLGGQQIWFEPETLRLNPDGRGTLLGEFSGDDKILVITKDGDAYTAEPAFEQHFEDNIERIEKFDQDKTWTVVYKDGETGQPYIKRFKMAATSKPIRITGDHPKCKLMKISDEDHPLMVIKYGGADEWRPSETIDVYEFIGEKGIKAKGKRLTTYEIGSIVELEPEIPSVRRNQSSEDSGEGDGEGETPEGEDGEQPTLF
ncbi:MAG: DNA gyrase/topoisomerase IV subunit A [Bacteroidales bacterium]|nr:DNA gyrase/topoisomerase IV subunit A [Bacteroidales bacterium]